MFKRKKALFFTLFAYTIVLALMVVPHHHHDDDICILNAFCYVDHNNDQGENNNHNHDSHNCDHDHLCLFDQDIVFRSNNIGPIFKALESADNLTGFDGFWITPFESAFTRYVPSYYSRAQFRMDSSMYSCYVSLCLGLRGPPTA